MQEDKEEDGDAAVVFPQALDKGATVLLRLSYRGDKVLRDVGDKNYVVGARESWYPNLGVFSDPAAFEMTYRVPAGNEVISVGRKTGETTEGKLADSPGRPRDRSPSPASNYGPFCRGRRTRFRGLRRPLISSGTSGEILSC